MTRAHEAVSTVHGGIMRPLREINGVAAGIKAALGHLASGRRSDVLQVTQEPARDLQVVRLADLFFLVKFVNCGGHSYAGFKIRFPTRKT